MSHTNSNIFFLGASGVKEYKFNPDRLPSQKEKRSLEWVEFGLMDDWKNQQPQYYEYLSRMSSKNGSILKAKNRYVWGKGFAVEETGLTRPEQIEIKGFLRSINKSRLFKRIISDRNLYGGFAVQMITSKGGNRVEPHYIPFKNIRVGKSEYDKDGNLEPRKYYYSTCWGESKTKIMEDPNFTEFTEWDWEQKAPTENDKYIIYYKDEGFEEDYYPLPDYQGGVPYIDADSEVGNFVMNNVKNGFTSGMLVQFFNGDPDPNTKAELETMWHNYLHGTDNAGKAMMAWLNNHDEEVKVTPLAPNGQDDRFLNLNGQILDEIFIAHCMSPMVVGLTGENGFSNNADEKRVAIEAFNEDFVETTQEIFNEFANELLLYNEIKGEVYLTRIDPVQAQLSEGALMEILERNELREMIGYEPIEGTVQQAREINIKFSKEQEDNMWIAFFENFGMNDTEFEVVDSFELYATDAEDAKTQAQSFKEQHFATKKENVIAGILEGNPNATPKQIAELTGYEEGEINSIMEDLAENPIVPEELFTVYKYEKRSDVKGASVIPTTREFCRRLVTLSQTRSWTIEDIQVMNNGMGLDVFTSRGGWYTIPNTNRHVPFCRHIWKAYLVKRI